MRKIYSNQDPELLCHLIVRKEDIISERLNVIDPDQYLQLAVMKLNKGKTFNAHKHNQHEDYVEEDRRAQESWVVISGEVQVMYYDLNGKYIKSDILYPGDASITLMGGHNYLILEDDTIVYEFKTGPYEGQVKDKEFI